MAIIEFGMDGTILDANRNFLDLMGYTLAEIRGRPHRILVAPDSADAADYAGLWAQLNRGEFFSGECMRIGKDRREVWLQASYNPVLGASGWPKRVVKFATDITAQKMRSAFDAGQIAAINRSQAVAHFALDGTILCANDNFLRMMGYEGPEIFGRHHSMFVPAEERDGDDYRAFWPSLARGEFRAAEFRRIGKDGRDVWIRASYNPILAPNGKPVQVVKFAVDITACKLERHAHLERMRHLAHHDPLTGLANRTELQGKLEEAFDAVRRGGGAVALYCIDLDRFKPVNDRYGHAKGDALLQAVAQRLRAVVRSTDTVARIGGDEFVIVQHLVGGSNCAGCMGCAGAAESVAATLVGALEKPFCIDGDVLEISASIGIALFPDGTARPEDLLDDADRALYQVKRNGRAGFACYRRTAVAGCV